MVIQFTAGFCKQCFNNFSEKFHIRDAVNYRLLPELNSLPVFFLLILLAYGMFTYRRNWLLRRHLNFYVCLHAPTLLTPLKKEKVILHLGSILFFMLHATTLLPLLKKEKLILHLGSIFFLSNMSVVAFD